MLAAEALVPSLRRQVISSHGIDLEVEFQIPVPFQSRGSRKGNISLRLLKPVLHVIG